MNDFPLFIYISDFFFFSFDLSNSLFSPLSLNNHFFIELSLYLSIYPYDIEQ